MLFGLINSPKRKIILYFFEIRLLRGFKLRLTVFSASSGAVLSNQQQSTSASVVPAVSGGSDPFGATSVASPSSAADFTDSSQSANSSNTGDQLHILHI